jgi:hypothetical protein
MVSYYFDFMLGNNVVLRLQSITGFDLMSGILSAITINHRN